jgi:hypothetical protein
MIYEGSDRQSRGHSIHDLNSLLVLQLHGSLQTLSVRFDHRLATRQFQEHQARVPEPGKIINGIDGFLEDLPVPRISFADNRLLMVRRLYE